MLAVLIEADVSGVDREIGLHGIRERLVPMISQMAGFVSGTWLTGNAEGLGLSRRPSHRPARGIAHRMPNRRKAAWPEIRTRARLLLVQPRGRA
jgi:hypothetical protein